MTVESELSIGANFNPDALNRANASLAKLKTTAKETDAALKGIKLTSPIDPTKMQAATASVKGFDTATKGATAALKEQEVVAKKNRGALDTMSSSINKVSVSKKKLTGAAMQLTGGLDGMATGLSRVIMGLGKWGLGIGIAMGLAVDFISKEFAAIEASKQLAAEMISGSDAAKAAGLGYIAYASQLDEMIKKQQEAARGVVASGSGEAGQVVATRVEQTNELIRQQAELLGMDMQEFGKKLNENQDKVEKLAESSEALRAAQADVARFEKAYAEAPDSAHRETILRGLNQARAQETLASAAQTDAMKNLNKTLGVDITQQFTLLSSGLAFLNPALAAFTNNLLNLSSQASQMMQQGYTQVEGGGYRKVTTEGNKKKTEYVSATGLKSTMTEDLTPKTGGGRVKPKKNQPSENVTVPGGIMPWSPGYGEGIGGPEEATGTKQESTQIKKQVLTPDQVTDAKLFKSIQQESAQALQSGITEAMDSKEAGGAAKAFGKMLLKIGIQAISLILATIPGVGPFLSAATMGVGAGLINRLYTGGILYPTGKVASFAEGGQLGKYIGQPTLAVGSRASAIIGDHPGGEYVLNPPQLDHLITTAAGRGTTVYQTTLRADGVIGERGIESHMDTAIRRATARRERGRMGR